MTFLFVQIKGLTDVDLNYPQHLNDKPKALKQFINDCGLTVNGMAMRYSTNPEFQLGAFTHPDAKIRKEAVELTKRGIDCGYELGTNLMTIWLVVEEIRPPTNEPRLDSLCMLSTLLPFKYCYTRCKNF